jgi:hypothetical protein
VLTVRLFLLCTAALLGAPAAAQNWVVYTPQERDFRVLFPSQPARLPGNDGTVAFRAQAESGDRTLQYTVYRLPTSLRRVGDEAQDIEKLLQARLGDSVPVRRVREEEPANDWQRYVFEYSRSISVNRLVGSGGRYYQLEVLIPGRTGSAGIQTARDFFASFQASGISIPGLVSGLSQGFDSWCQGRTDPFTRAFCEYSVCLQAAFEQDPRCAALFKR